MSSQKKATPTPQPVDPFEAEKARHGHDVNYEGVRLVVPCLSACLAPLPSGVMKYSASLTSCGGPVHPQPDIVLFKYRASGRCEGATELISRAEACEKIRKMWKELRKPNGRYSAGVMEGKLGHP